MMVEILDIDEARERQINNAYFRMQAARTPKERKAAWDDMQAAVKSRSKQKVEQMEQEQGLREIAKRLGI